MKTGFIATMLLAIALASLAARAIAADSQVSQLLSESDFSKLPAAQTTPVQGTTPLDVTRNADELTHQFNLHREDNKVFEVGILSVLALAMLFVTLRYLSRNHSDPGPHIVNATGLVCIIFGTMLLVLMAQSDQQLTAAMGILGAIAGYLFRSMREEPKAATRSGGQDAAASPTNDTKAPPI